MLADSHEGKRKILIAGGGVELAKAFVSLGEKVGQLSHPDRVTSRFGCVCVLGFFVCVAFLIPTSTRFGGCAPLREPECGQVQQSSVECVARNEKI